MTTGLYSMNDRAAFNFFFNNFLSNRGWQPFNSSQKLGYPADVYWSADALNFEIPIADANVDDIKVKIDDDALIVMYHRSDKIERNYVYNGISKRDFRLGWIIPSNADASKIESSYKNGLLKITIPRSEQSFPKEIKVIDLNETKQLN